MLGEAQIGLPSDHIHKNGGGGGGGLHKLTLTL